MISDDGKDDKDYLIPIALFVMVAVVGVASTYFNYAEYKECVKVHEPEKCK